MKTQTNKNFSYIHTRGTRIKNCNSLRAFKRFLKRASDGQYTLVKNNDSSHPLSSMNITFEKKENKFIKITLEKVIEEHNRMVKK